MVKSLASGKGIGFVGVLRGCSEGGYSNSSDVASINEGCFAITCW